MLEQGDTMSDLHRRDFLTGAAAFAAGVTAALAGTRRAEAGDPSFMNNVPDWLGHTPKALLAKNFGLPESAFDGFPKSEVYFARGKVPPEKAAPPIQGMKLPPQTHKFELLAQDPHALYKGGKEWRVDSS